MTVATSPIPAAAYHVGAYQYDNSGAPIDITQFIHGKDGYKMLSQELRISSAQEQRFRYVAGLFYEQQQHDILQDYLINNLAGPDADPGVESLEVTGWPDTWWLTNQKRVDTDYAAFGEVSYDITDKLTGTVGIRFFKTKNTLEGFFGFGLTQSWSSRTGEKNPLCTQHPEDFRGAPCKNLDKEVDEYGQLTQGEPDLSIHRPGADLRHLFGGFPAGRCQSCR